MTRININIPYLNSADHRETNYCLQRLRILVRWKVLRVALAFVFLYLLIVNYYYFFFSMLYCVTFIQVDSIENYLHPVTIKTVNASMPLCLLFEKYDTVIDKNFVLNETVLSNLGTKLDIRKGGAWKPKQCIAQHEVALIVPYRNRDTQLKIFLCHIHQFLQKQFISYQIFVVEQRNLAEFNRGKLLNIGYLEALKIKPFHCFIFHDVDLMPVNPNNIYACTKQPRHMSVALNTFNYELPYCAIVGGATAMLRHQFRQVNGFSNFFFGWGAEDDDLFNRITNHYSICRFNKKVSEYVMLSHEKQNKSERRWQLLKDGAKRFKTDGLNTLQHNYSVVSNVELPLETHIVVDL